MTAAADVRRGARFEAGVIRAEPALLAALVDYRGDVTIECSDETRTGYLFEVTAGPIRLRMLPSDGGAALTIPLDDISAVTVTGRDTAEGKSFDTWVRKYAEQKLGIKVPGKEGQDE